MQVMREAAGEAYILACGAPILPSIGLCDGIRVGPDVSPFWINKAMTVWLNNPNDTSTQNAIRTSIHRLWLSPLVNIDPDVMYFREIQCPKLRESVVRIWEYSQGSRLRRICCAGGTVRRKKFGNF
jgi:hypothetical protein